MDFLKLAKNYLEDAIKDLQDLVRIPSVLDEFRPNSETPFGIHNKEALEQFLKISEKLGFETENDQNYAGAAIWGSNNKELLGILAHLDVVPIVGTWTFGPFNPVISDGKMYGRGTLDDKCGVIASLYAMKLLKDQGFMPNKQIKVIAGCDEETGSRCLSHYLKNFRMPDLAFSPDASFPVIYGEKGILSFDIEGDINSDDIISVEAGLRYNIVIDEAILTLKQIDLGKIEEFKKNNPNEEIIILNNKIIFKGLGAHASTPQYGKNACYTMFKFLNMFYQTNFSLLGALFDNSGLLLGIDLKDAEMGELTLNLGLCNLSNGHYKLGLNLRVPLDSHELVMRQKLDKLLPQYNAKITNWSYSKSHYVDPNGFLVSNLQASYQEISNDSEHKPFVIGGGTYAKAIKEAVAFGPCFPWRKDICHEPDEHIYIEDLEKWIAIYANAIYRLTK